MIRYEPQTLGAEYLGQNHCRFRVWAPEIDVVHVHLLRSDHRVRLKKARCGYHEVVLEDSSPGERYVYSLDGEKERPDPASRFQPQGVHGPSAILEQQFSWDDEAWRGLPLAAYIIYEAHVGAFTPAGTFEAIIPQLAYLGELGVTALELMPVAQFPGSRNWGYDGVFPFAVQNSYGGPKSLKSLVNACHQRGLAVILDVVYNHLGPEGNYLSDFGPYFTDRYRTPWGAALNFDGPHSDQVRNFFLQSALQWLRDFHIDALRLDAVHAILDHSPITFLEQLVEAVKEEAARLDRRVFLIAESADNNARLVCERERGGYGMDAQWNDDFHHCLHTLLTGELEGYYQDYGNFGQLAKTYRDGFAYTGEYSKFRRRRHGSGARDISPKRLVVFAQNHDQVGNRRLGDRLCGMVSLEDLKLAAGLVLLSPFIPLLFMGEEYGNDAPFPYFIDHSDPKLIEAVRHGRQREFGDFAWRSEIPDPQAETTFLSAKLRHELRAEGRHKILFDFYRALIELRKTEPALKCLDKDSMEVVAHENEKILAIERREGTERILLVANLSAAAQAAPIDLGAGRWRKLLDSAEERWRGPGTRLDETLNGPGSRRVKLAPRSFGLFRLQGASR